MDNWKAKIAEARKAVTALIGVASLALSQGLITGTAAKWTGLAISLATAIGVYAVPNADPVE